MDMNLRLNIRRIAAVVLGVALTVLLGDLAYSTWTRIRLARWEQTIERDDDGVRQGCAAFDVGAPDAPAILMIHGFADSPAVFDIMASELAERGYRCRSMRLPGFAKPMDEYRQTNLDVWRCAIETEIAALSGPTGRPVWLLGHSTGATLALDRCLRNPQSIAGLVLVAPLLDVSDRRSPLRIPPRIWFKIAETLLPFTRIVENRFPLDAYSPAAAEHPRDTFIPRVMYGELFRLVDAVHLNAHGLELPIQCIFAGRDQVVDGKAAEAFVREHAHGLREFVFLPYSGHLVPLDRQWQEATNKIAEFLDDTGL